MQVQALARVQGSVQQPRQASGNAKRAVLKALPGMVPLLGAGAASAAPVPFGASSSAGGAAASLPAVSLPSLPAVDLPSLPAVDGLNLDGIDPLVVAAGVALVALPLGLSAFIGGGGPKAKAVPAATAVQALQADAGCLLVDIRSKAEAKEAGAPSLKGISKRGALALPFTAVVKGELVVDEAFGRKVAAARGVEAEGKPLILLDSDGTLAAAASKAILRELPKKKVFYVSGGAEAWQAAGLPWKEPARLALPDLSALTLESGVKAVVGGAQQLYDEYQEAPTVAKGLIAAGAVAGAGVFLFSQAELLLEVAGIFAAGQFLLKNLLFAEDRKETLSTLKRVADQLDVPDLPKDLGRIATTLLEDPTAAPQSNSNGRAAGAPAPAAPPTAVPVVPVAAAAAASAEAAPTHKAVEVAAEV